MKKKNFKIKQMRYVLSGYAMFEQVCTINTGCTRTLHNIITRITSSIIKIHFLTLIVRILLSNSYKLTYSKLERIILYLLLLLLFQSVWENTFRYSRKWVKCEDSERPEWAAERKTSSFFIILTIHTYYRVIQNDSSDFKCLRS